MNAKQAVVALITGIGLVLAAGNTSSLSAGEENIVRGGGNNAVGNRDADMPLTAAGEELERTPASAMVLTEDALQKEYAALQAKAMQDKNVKAARQKAIDQQRAFHASRDEHPEIKALADEREKLLAAYTEIRAARPTNRDRNAWRRWGRTFQDNRRRLGEILLEIQTITEKDPKLLEAKVAADAAWLAFLDIYTKTLEAMPGYQQLVMDQEDLRFWTEQLSIAETLEQRREQRRQREEAAADRAQDEAEVVEEDAGAVF